MENKPKTCNGINQAKGFKGCGKPTLYRQYGLGKMCGCYSKWLLTTDNGKLHLSKAILKASKPRLELEKADNEKRQSESLKLAKSNTKQVVHEFVRERDKYKPCVSCGCEWNSDFQAGHHYKAETFETLKYNLDNINGQCYRCNNFMDGAFDNYALNLPKRIGQERYNNLVYLASIDKQQSKVWNFDNLKAIRDEVRRLKKSLI